MTQQYTLDEMVGWLAEFFEPEGYEKVESYQDDLGAVNQLISAFSFRLDPDLTQILLRDQTIDGPGIYQEQPLPTSTRIARVAHGDGNLCHSHFHTSKRNDSLP